MKKIKPEDYFKNGLFEMARFGNNIFTSNNMTEEQYAQFISGLADQYDDENKIIDDIIHKIKEKLNLVEPLPLFNFLTTMNTMALMNSDIITELEISNEVNYQLRSVEYIQSLLVSMQHDTKNEIKISEQEPIYNEILSLCIELYKNIQVFYLLWFAKQQKIGDFSFEEEDYIVYAQMMSQVRGEQYQVFRLPILKELLLPYNELLQEIYGLSVTDVISGLTVLEKNLSSGRLDAMQELGEQIDKLSLYDDKELAEADFYDSQEIVQKVIGVSLFDVKKNTAWSDEFINDFCLDINSDSSFLRHDEFSGWPIWNLPIQYKPFIRLNEIVYCFDYYNLFDNFYVALQRAIRNHGDNYGDKWNEIQGHSSEKIVGSVFECLLPGCVVHYSNFYPISKNGSAENDIIIEYKDVLIIIEVKAGTFVYTSAMMDFKAHKKSFKDLVEKAENQCIRVKNYISEGEDRIRSFYSGDKLDSEAFSIDREKYSQIYMLDVTVSDFNEFASRMEKISIAKVHTGIIALSLNDLWVYKHYFDKPLQFIHFLKQRTIATNTVEIAVSDELDHLGLYIKHNMYSLQAKDIGQGSQVNFVGYREEVDKYISSLHLGLNYEKPSQLIPKEIDRILEILLNKNDEVTLFSNFMLDMDYERRGCFSNTIINLIKREKELGRMVPAVYFGDINYCLFVALPGIATFSEEKCKKYILANLVRNKRDECWSITVIYDEHDNIADIRYKLYKQSDISETERLELEEYGKEIVEHRINHFLVQNNKRKIYPNDKCLCGSGKKYKYCCGRQ